MTSAEIRKKFLEFFKKRGHTIVSSSSLLPDDPSVLLTTAGMQQFKRYYTGELDAMKDFGSKNTASVQKSFRTSDIDEVGDESHLTFFEMLGNFSFGGYFKEEAIKYGYEFITGKEWVGLAIDKVTVFDPVRVSRDDWRKGVPLDRESLAIWKKYLPEEKIHLEGADNFWGPTGNEGPCGPTTEIYVNTALRRAQGKPPLEIWNIVFNEFYCDAENKLTPLKTPGVDTGMGLERLAMVSQNAPTIFETDLFAPLMNLLPKEMPVRHKRIFADHIRGFCFLVSDGVRPSNKDAGYVLRRLVRRVMVYDYLITQNSKEWEQLQLGGGIQKFIDSLIEQTVRQHKDFYRELDINMIFEIFQEEAEKFRHTMKQGVAKIAKLNDINAKTAFQLYESFGLPFEIIKELGIDKTKKLQREDFDKEFAKHQEISRAGQEKKFGGHGLILNTGELKAGNEEELNKVLRLHTATHLLQRALREVLGPEVRQTGSDITAERTRFDFAFPRKMTEEEKKKVEELVNKKIKEDLSVQFVELPKNEAEKSGALYFFKEKYPEKVKVYFVGKDLKSAWSKEFCGGPHVTNTGIIGKFRIAKEEAVGAGARRIRGVVD